MNLDPDNLPYLNRLSVNAMSLNEKWSLVKSAYCHEIGKVISNEMAWDLLHNKKNCRSPLTFKCPDLKCSARFITRNCKNYLSPTETEFRVYSGDRHHPDCTYIQAKVALRKFYSKKPSLPYRTFF